jgi:hypothetical protein
MPKRRKKEKIKKENIPATRSHNTRRRCFRFPTWNIAFWVGGLASSECSHLPKHKWPKQMNKQGRKEKKMGACQIRKNKNKTFRTVPVWFYSGIRLCVCFKRILSDLIFHHHEFKCIRTQNLKSNQPDRT